MESGSVDTRAVARRRAGTLLATAAVAALLASVVAWAKLGEELKTPQVEARPLTVVTATLDQASGYARQRTYVGVIEAARESDVGFELDGRVTEILADEGDSVSRGQPLARLDVARLEARRAELEASLGETQARRRLAQITVQRTRGLVERDAASRQRLDEDREALHALLAAEQLAKARLESNAVELDKAILLAPYDAVVTRRFVDEGRVLESGTPLLRLMQASAPEARVGIAGHSPAPLADDRIYRLDVHGRQVRARIKTMLPVRDSLMRTVDVVFKLETFDASLRSGDLVRLTLPEPVEVPGYWVSVSALTAGPRGLWCVYVADREQGSRSGATHRLQARIVEVVHSDGDRAYVRGDLASGDLLVSDGLHRLVAGQPVQVTTAGERMRADNEWVER